MDHTHAFDDFLSWSSTSNSSVGKKTIGAILKERTIAAQNKQKSTGEAVYITEGATNTAGTNQSIAGSSGNTEVFKATMTATTTTQPTAATTAEAKQRGTTATTTTVVLPSPKPMDSSRNSSNDKREHVNNQDQSNDTNTAAAEQMGPTGVSDTFNAAQNVKNNSINDSNDINNIDCNNTNNTSGINNINVVDDTNSVDWNKEVVAVIGGSSPLGRLVIQGCDVQL